MSDQPALDLAKRLNEKIEGFVGYSRSHHDIGLELMRAAQSACTAIEQLSNEIESLTSENTRLRALLQVVAEDDLDADAADGVTVLQVVIKEARGLLAIKEKIE